MRRPSAIIGFALALASASALLGSCYETSQGLRYLSIRSRAESIDHALADSRTSPQLRLLLERARAARSFALAELGLRQTKSYDSVVILDGDRLATVVQACAELSFTRYLWTYPVVGPLPYRGYFDPKEAQREAARLKKQGLDVIARPVDAFSSLGWLADPLFSFMSSYSEAEVAELVIHEMTHATIFLKGGRPAAPGGARVDTEQFNEELATFVGREGSLLYLSRKYGNDAKELATTLEEREDGAALTAFLAGTAKELEALYASTVSDDEKRRRKAEIIAARAALFKRDYSSLFKGELYRDFAMDRINNAYLDLYRIYEGETSLYRDFYTRICGGDMRLFIQTISRIAKLKRDPKAEMRRLLSEAGGSR
jgi:predicted aminopeptidase